MPLEHNVVSRVEYLWNLAVDLRKESLPVRAFVLDVLSAMRLDEVLCLAREGIQASDIQRIASIVSCSERVVAGVLDKLFRLDIVDYSDQYAAYENAFLSAGRISAEAMLLLKGESIDECIFCVLHAALYEWNITQSGFGAPIIEDDSTYELCCGYLVSEGMAFGSRVELLAYSLRNSWPDLKHLWAYC
jgi:hypothetical protein